VGENVRTITMSVRGGFINDLALEKCYLDHDMLRGRPPDELP